MRAQLLSFIVVAVLSEASDIRTCSRIGIQCSDCQTLSECVEDDDGIGYHYDKDRKCPENAVCDEFPLYCQLDGFCRSKDFECPRKDYEDEQVFPDPFLCNRYYGCEGQVMYSYICKEGTAFNPTTKNCSLPADAFICIDYPIPLCEDENFTAEIPNSDYMYTCVKELEPIRRIYPVVYLKNDPLFTTSNAPTTGISPSS